MSKRKNKLTALLTEKSKPLKVSKSEHEMDTDSRVGNKVSEFPDPSISSSQSSTSDISHTNSCNEVNANLSKKKSKAPNNGLKDGGYNKKWERLPMCAGWLQLCGKSQYRGLYCDFADFGNTSTVLRLLAKKCNVMKHAASDKHKKSQEAWVKAHNSSFPNNESALISEHMDLDKTSMANDHVKAVDLPNEFVMRVGDNIEKVNSSFDVTMSDVDSSVTIDEQSSVVKGSNKKFTRKQINKHRVLHIRKYCQI